MQAITRVEARYFIESTAKDSSASICSVTRMPPSSAPMPAPTRPDSSRAVTSGPVSLIIAIARACGIKASAPKRSSEARVCIDITTPTARPDSPISGAERSPSDAICATISWISNGGRKASRSARTPKKPISPACRKKSRIISGIKLS